MPSDKPPSSNILSNVPEFSVSELALSLKKTIEDQYSRVRVRGELSRVKIHSSGHMYTDLKDQDSVLNAVCWRGTLAKLSVKPEEGLEVICTGRISTYPSRSNYQLIIEAMELAGEGALLKILEERRKKLAAEGLFEPQRKRPLPFMPRVIGVVTSPTGAVIRDILHRLSDRFPVHVLVWPVPVQGAGAAQQIAAAISGFDALAQGGAVPRPDLLIVARGGGSLEDLMPFNEESVVRAAASCGIPLISAIGHETDTTLLDFAADARAPTPTGAAEMAVPVRAQLRAQVVEDHQRLLSAMQRFLQECGHRLSAQRRGLGDPERLLEGWMQRVDRMAEKMGRIGAVYIGAKRETLLQRAAALRPPALMLQRGRQTAQRWAEGLEGLRSKILEGPQQKLLHQAQMLEAYSYTKVLARGFAVVRGARGSILADADSLSEGQDIDIEFRGGRHVRARAGRGDS